MRFSTRRIAEIKSQSKQQKKNEEEKKNLQLYGHTVDMCDRLRRTFTVHCSSVHTILWVMCWRTRNTRYFA